MILVEVFFLNNLNKDDTIKFPIAGPNIYTSFNSNPNGTIGTNTMSANPENINLKIFPYIALKNTKGTITSGTIIIRILTFP